MNTCDVSYVYDDSDIISDVIVNFYNLCDCKDELKGFMDCYFSNKEFFLYIQKNFLVKKISIPYLMRLYNDYDSDNIVNEYDYISRVNTTRWI